MHLSECFAAGFAAFSSLPVVGESTDLHPPPPDADFSECVSGWFLKTTTSFHGSEELFLPAWFGLFCLSFSLGGLVMMLVEPRWTRRSAFPYRSFAFLLIFFQGPLSFLADYMNMTNDSAWHVIDRFMAIPLLLLEMSKVIAMFPHVRVGTFAAYAASCAGAVACFMNSQAAQAAIDVDGFVFWHGMWHAYPLVGSAIMLFDCFVLGECDRAELDGAEMAEAKKGASTTKQPKLLSTMLMEGSPPPSSPVRGREQLRRRI